MSTFDGFLHTAGFRHQGRNANIWQRRFFTNSEGLMRVILRLDPEHKRGTVIIKKRKEKFGNRWEETFHKDASIVQAIGLAVMILKKWKNDSENQLARKPRHAYHGRGARTAQGQPRPADHAARSPAGRHRRGG